MKRFTLMCSALATAIVLGACQTTPPIQTAPAANPIPPVEARRAVVGDQFVYLTQSGTQTTTTTVAASANRASYKQDNGCSYSHIITGFGPNPEWSNCGGSSGNQTSKRTGGSIFPLAVGSSESWDYSGTNSKGNNWESTRNCTVPGAVSVTVPAGTFDTYHVRCEDKWWVRESYINADGIAVRWSRTIKSGSGDRNRSGELVSFTPAST